MIKRMFVMAGSNLGKATKTQKILSRYPLASASSRSSNSPQPTRQLEETGFHSQINNSLLHLRSTWLKQKLTITFSGSQKNT